jgi:ribose 5-phosphate isomerase B
VYYGEPAHTPQGDIIALSREHNDANVLSLGARFITPEEAKEKVSQWLSTPFSNDERHIRRITALDA